MNEIRCHPIIPSLIASAGSDESVRLWNVQSGACIAIFAGHFGHRDDVLSIVRAFDWSTKLFI